MSDPLTPERLAEIEARANAAELSEEAAMDLWWEACDDEWAVPVRVPSRYLRHVRSVMQDSADIPALLAEVRRLQAAVERVRELHHRVDVGVIVGDCAREECDHEGACPEVPFAVCDACYSIADQIDPYLYERGGVDVVKWPCPTIAALDGEP